MYRTEKERLEGYVAIDIGECEYRCPAYEYANVLAAFTGGKAFVETYTMFSEKVTLKMARVISVIFVTPESIVERDKDEEARKAAELVEND